MYPSPSKTSSKVAAVIFDWAGTVIDYGSQAPMAAFVEAFATFGVDITIAEARVPMGLPKRAHIEAILDLPRISQKWEAVRGLPPEEPDVDAVYEVFIPLNQATVADHCALISGVLETVAELRHRGIKIGSTTGYTRSIMERVLPLVAAQGYAPDNLICSDDLQFGRPTPFGMFKCFLDLEVWDVTSVIKVDDTVPGIAEGVSAGCWTVGVTLSGNAVGLSEAEVAVLSEDERQRLHEKVGRELLEAGAHFIIPTAAELLSITDRVDELLKDGIGPSGSAALSSKRQVEVHGC